MLFMLGKSRVSVALAIAAIIVYIVAFFLGIELGSELSYYDEFTFSIALICWLIGYIFGSLLLGISAIVQNTFDSANRLASISVDLDKIANATKAASSQPPSPPSSPTERQSPQTLVESYRASVNHSIFDNQW